MEAANNPVSSLEKASRIRSANATRTPKAALAATPGLFKFTTPREGIKLLQKCRCLFLGTKKKCYWPSFNFDYSLCFNYNYNYGTSFIFTTVLVLNETITNRGTSFAERTSSL